MTRTRTTREEQPFDCPQTGQAFYDDGTKASRAAGRPDDQLVQQMVAEETQAHAARAGRASSKRPVVGEQHEAEQQELAGQDVGARSSRRSDGLGQLYDANRYDPERRPCRPPNEIKALRFAERDALERAHPGIIEQVHPSASQWRWRQEEDGGKDERARVAEADRRSSRPRNSRTAISSSTGPPEATSTFRAQMTKWQRELRGKQLGFRIPRRRGWRCRDQPADRNRADLQIRDDKLPPGCYTLEELPARPGASSFALETGPGGARRLRPGPPPLQRGRAATSHKRIAELVPPPIEIKSVQTKRIAQKAESRDEYVLVDAEEVHGRVRALEPVV